MNQSLPQYYCIGHKEPAFEPGSSYLHISSEVFPHLRQLIVPDDAYGERFHGSILSEYTQLLALYDLLKDSPPDEYFYMFQYRKFISFKATQQASPNMPYAYAVPTTEANVLFPSPEEIATLNGKLLVSPALKVESMARNYAKHHVIEDFAAFTISLRESGYFDEDRCRQFINCQTFFPSSSMGLHRVDMFLRHMDILKAVWSHFAEHFHVRREGYQRRSGAFLLERLQGFLLYEELIVHKSVAAQLGKMIVVSETPIIQPTI